MQQSVQPKLLSEKEPIKFTVNTENVPEDIQLLVKHIHEVAKRYVYHWKIFPIVLPDYVVILCSESSTLISSKPQQRSSCYNYDSSNVSPEPYRSVGRRIPRHINVKDLFSSGPVFDELEAAALNNNGQPKRLNSKQLDSIKKRGIFSVTSINFPGKAHTWKISSWLQKGRESTQETLADDIAFAIRFLIITAMERINSSVLSIMQAIKMTKSGLLKLLDLLIGLPSLETLNLKAKIQEERTRYLVAELVCKPGLEYTIEQLCSFINAQLTRAKIEKFNVWQNVAIPAIPIPYLFLTPKGVEIDLHLFHRYTLQQGTMILIEIVRRETRGWFLHFRERLISKLREQKLSEKEIEEKVNEAVMNEYLERVYKSILSNPDMRNLGENIPKLFVDQAQSTLLMNRAVENTNLKVAKCIEREKECLIYENPLLSRIDPWVNKKLKKIQLRLASDHMWDAHEEAIALCTEAELHQTVYFLQRDLNFVREREPVLLKELENVKIPTRVFNWVTQIWFPRNWIVERSFQGRREIISTLLTMTSTNITMPRSDQQQAVYLVKKGITRRTTTSWPFWRWMNYIHRTWSWMWNVMFFFGIFIPLCSPVSMRALLCINPFCSDLELSQINGTLFPRRSSLTPTLYSRLYSLWRHISKSRTEFETKPDTGFVGKDMNRQLNRFWNYVIKGIFGTLAILIIFPVICVSASLMGFLIAVTTPIWMPILTLVLHFSMGIIYDIDGPDISRNRISIASEALFWNICIQGIAQFTLAIGIIVVCPAIFVFVIIAGILRYGLRLAWDSVIFHLLIKKRGRIPSSNSCFVTRIAGPGFDSNYYLQIRPEQALAAFEAKLEYDELQAYKIQMEDIIRQPLVDFKKFVQMCFGPLSAQPSKNGVLADLEKEAHSLYGVLNEKINQRTRFLETGLCTSTLSKIRLSAADLKVTIQQAGVMLENFYPQHVLNRLSLGEEEYWESRGLVINDWTALASQLFIQIFSSNFVVPLHDSDTIYKLKPEPHVDLRRFTEMIRNIKMNTNCPDLLGTVYTPQGNIHINSPRLDVSAFSPGPNYKLKVDIINAGITLRPYFQGTDTSSSANILADTIKQMNNNYNMNKLTVPLLIPHPAEIAVIVHNRDCVADDDVIPMDSSLFKEIMRAIEGKRDDAPVENSYQTTDAENCRVENNYFIPRRQEEPAKCSAAITCPSSAVEISNRQSITLEWKRPSLELNLFSEEPSSNVKVDLASPEDINLELDSLKADFHLYGTTV